MGPILGSEFAFYCKIRYDFHSYISRRLTGQSNFLCLFEISHYQCTVQSVINTKYSEPSVNPQLCDFLLFFDTFATFKDSGLYKGTSWLSYQQHHGSVNQEQVGSTQTNLLSHQTSRKQTQLHLSWQTRMMNQKCNLMIQNLWNALSLAQISI